MRTTEHPGVVYTDAAARSTDEDVVAALRAARTGQPGLPFADTHRADTGQLTLTDD